MEFKDALQLALKENKAAANDPFLLHSQVSDLIGNNGEQKKAAESFFYLDSKYQISSSLVSAFPKRQKKRKKHYYKLKPIDVPSDDAYVYFNYETPTIHLSKNCPVLKNDFYVLRNTYKWARFNKYLDEVNIKTTYYANSDEVRSFRPHFCTRCGDFTPEFSSKHYFRITDFLYDWFCFYPKNKMIYRK